jgi:heterodisulfide reductase subunit B
MNAQFNQPGRAFSYYPGCTGASTSREYDLSTRAVCEHLGLKLVDMPDWNCCGSTPAHTVDHALSAALCSRNFAQAEELGLETMLTPCPSCLKNMHNCLERLKEPEFAARVRELTRRPLAKNQAIKSVLQVFYEEITTAGIARQVKKPLKGLRFVAYYGCLMNRPGRFMHFDDEENPVAMDRILEALGAEALPYPLKNECCGGAAGIADNKVVARLSGKLLQLADALGADALVTACPLCQMNLDLRQRQANRFYGTSITLPVFYFTQLMGLAFGLPRKKLGLGKLIVSPKSALAKTGRGQPDIMAHNLDGGAL